MAEPLNQGNDAEQARILTSELLSGISNAQERRYTPKKLDIYLADVEASIEQFALQVRLFDRWGLLFPCCEIDQGNLIPIDLGVIMPFLEEFAEIPRLEAKSFDAVSETEQIARLAYFHWEARGRQGGSPEDDWYRAEEEVRRRQPFPFELFLWNQPFAWLGGVDRRFWAEWFIERGLRRCFVKATPRLGPQQGMEPVPLRIEGHRPHEVVVFIRARLEEFLTVRFRARHSDISTSPGLQFQVTTQTSGLRVHYSPAYFFNGSNVFGGPTSPPTPVLGWIQPGRYIFGAGGGNVQLQFDYNAHYSIPHQRDAYLYI